MIFYLIYYLLLFGYLLITPYLVFRYIMSGDQYLMISSPVLAYGWLFILSFLGAYALNSIKSFYTCFIDRGSQGGDSTSASTTMTLDKIVRGFHSSLISSVYYAIYLAIFSTVGYLVGSTVIETIPQLKELLLAVIHIPGFEFILKGVSVTVGGLVGHLLASFCLDLKC